MSTDHPADRDEEWEKVNRLVSPVEAQQEWERTNERARWIELLKKNNNHLWRRHCVGIKWLANSPYSLAPPFRAMIEWRAAEAHYCQVTLENGASSPSLSLASSCTNRSFSQCLLLLIALIIIDEVLSVQDHRPASSSLATTLWSCLARLRWITITNRSEHW